MVFGRRINYTDEICRLTNKNKALCKKIKKFKKLYNEILQLQDMINTYGCNMKILLECSNIPDLKEHGNQFSLCIRTCKDKKSCNYYKIVSSISQ